MLIVSKIDIKLNKNLKVRFFCTKLHIICINDRDWSINPKLILAHINFKQRISASCTAPFITVKNCLTLPYSMKLTSLETNIKIFLFCKFLYIFHGQNRICLLTATCNIVLAIWLRWLRNVWSNETFVVLYLEIDPHSVWMVHLRPF